MNSCDDKTPCQCKMVWNEIPLTVMTSAFRMLIMNNTKINVTYERSDPGITIYLVQNSKIEKANNIFPLLASCISKSI